MRVLHLIKTNVGAGWAFREIKHLKQSGVDNFVVLPSDSVGFALKYRDEGIRVLAADVDLTKRTFRAAQKIAQLKSIIKSVRPDIVHSHFAGTTATARLALRRQEDIPLVFQVPGPLHLESLPTKLLDLKTMRKNDYYIATIDYVQRLLISAGVPKNRVFLSYYGTEVPLERPARTGKLRGELGLNENVPLIGIVAYMYPPKRFLGQRSGLKGHEYFIEAVSLLRRDYPELRGVIIGSQWGQRHDYEDSLRKMARAICGDAIIFTGFRNDVQAIYPDLDVAVHPSLSENAGGAVESLLCGVPTVASRVGGLADIVKDGLTGYTFAPRSSADMARAIRLILSDPVRARAMAEAGRARMLELFDVRKTAEQVRRIYETIASTPKEPRV